MLQNLMANGMGTTPVALQSSRGGLGDETAGLISNLIGVNALKEEETRNSLAIVRAAFEKPKTSSQPPRNHPERCSCFATWRTSPTRPSSNGKSSRRSRTSRSDERPRRPNDRSTHFDCPLNKARINGLVVFTSRVNMRLVGNPQVNGGVPRIESRYLLPIMENIWRLPVGGLATATNTSTGWAVLRQLDAETPLRTAGLPRPPTARPRSALKRARASSVRHHIGVKCGYVRALYRKGPANHLLRPL
jgi:hypothetical protein